jgi:hypothetical protein
MVIRLVRFSTSGTMGSVFACVLVGLRANGEMAVAKIRNEARADRGITSSGKCIPVD